MPKLKTNRAAAKRFRVNKNGKVKCRSAFRSHILSKVSSKRKRKMRAGMMVAESDLKEVLRLLRIS